MTTVREDTTPIFHAVDAPSRLDGTIHFVVEDAVDESQTRDASCLPAARGTITFVEESAPASNNTSVSFNIHDVESSIRVRNEGKQDAVRPATAVVHQTGPTADAAVSEYSDVESVTAAPTHAIAAATTTTEADLQTSNHVCVLPGAQWEIILRHSRITVERTVVAEAAKATGLGPEHIRVTDLIATATGLETRLCIAHDPRQLSTPQVDKLLNDCSFENTLLLHTLRTAPVKKAAEPEPSPPRAPVIVTIASANLSDVASNDVDAVGSTPEREVEVAKSPVHITRRVARSASVPLPPPSSTAYSFVRRPGVRYGGHLVIRYAVKPHEPRQRLQLYVDRPLTHLTGGDVRHYLAAHLHLRPRRLQLRCNGFDVVDGTTGAQMGWHNGVTLDAVLQPRTLTTSSLPRPTHGGSTRFDLTHLTAPTASTLAKRVCKIAPPAPTTTTTTTVTQPRVAAKPHAVPAIPGLALPTTSSRRYCTPTESSRRKCTVLVEWERELPSELTAQRTYSVRTPRTAKEPTARSTPNPLHRHPTAPTRSLGRSRSRREGSRRSVGAAPSQTSHYTNTSHTFVHAVEPAQRVLRNVPATHAALTRRAVRPVLDSHSAARPLRLTPTERVGETRSVSRRSHSPNRFPVTGVSQRAAAHHGAAAMNGTQEAATTTSPPAAAVTEMDEPAPEPKAPNPSV